MGVDRAILVETDAPLDVIAVSSAVAQVARSEQIDLIFCGGQQADWDSHALGAATAEGWNGHRRPGPVRSSSKMEMTTRTCYETLLLGPQQLGSICSIIDTERLRVQRAQRPFLLKH
jgi:hypothetical protein